MKGETMAEAVLEFVCDLYPGRLVKVGVWRYVAELPKVFEFQEAPGLAIYREIHGPFPPETDLEQNEWTWRQR